MIKIILSTLISVFAIAATVVIFYWKDAGFEPTAHDLLMYLAVIPFAVACVLLSPYLIYKLYVHRREKQQQRLEQAEAEKNQVPVQEEAKKEQIQLHVYSSFLKSAMGENDEILAKTIDLQAPELDSKLHNAQGNPILSYRMTDLDDDQDIKNQDVVLDVLQQRMHQLIHAQIAQNYDVLHTISHHFKRSAMFYDHKTIEKYRLHPAWLDPKHQTVDEDDDVEKIEAVPRLSQLVVYVILAEHLFRVWDTAATTALIAVQLVEMGFLNDQVQIEYEFWSSKNGYANMLQTFRHIATATDQVYLCLGLDSEIHQGHLENQLWVSADYVPAEFAGSFIVAPQAVEILELKPSQTMTVAFDQPDLLALLKDKKIDELPQFKDEQPFVVILDQIDRPKVIQQLAAHFEHTPIETYHYIYSCPSLGHTQHLSKLYGLMLGLVSFHDLYGLLYSVHDPAIHILLDPNPNSELEADANASTPT